MKKPIVKNWMRYWAGTLAISGMLAMGACSSSQTAANDRDMDRTGTAEGTYNDGTVATDDTTYGTGTETTGTTTTGTTGTTGTPTTGTTETTTGTSRTTDGTQTGTAQDTDYNRTGTQTGTTGTQTGTQTDTTGERENVNQQMQDDDTRYDEEQVIDQNSTTQGTDQQRANQTGQDQGRAQADATKPWEDPNKRVTGIDAHVRKFSDVNDAIEQVLAEQSRQERETVMAQGGQQMYGNQQTGENQDMATGDQQNTTQEGVSYDRMSDTPQQNYDADDRDTDTDVDVNADVDVDTDANTATGVDVDADADVDVNRTDEQTGVRTGTQTGTTGTQTDNMTEQQRTEQTDAARQNMNNTQQSDVTYDKMGNTAMGEEDNYMSAYDAHLNNAELDLSPEERSMLEEARADFAQRRESMQGQMDPELGAYYAPVVEARPSVKFGELAEEIREEMNLPAELEDAKIEGTVLVRFIVDEEGDIESAEVIDGILGERGEDGSLNNSFRLSEETKEGIVDEIENENLIKLSSEDKDRIVEAIKAESTRAVRNTSGKWQAATQEEKPVKMVMLMPLRVALDN